MKTFSVYYDNEETLKKFIILNKINESENVLVQVFTSSTNLKYIEKLQESINKNFLNPKIIGTTTDGIIGKETVNTDLTLISISIFNSVKVKTTLVDHKNNNSFLTGKKIIKKLLVEDSKVLISFTDGLNTNGEEYLKGITSIKNDIIVSGGMAGDNAEFKTTFVFNENGITSNGAVAAILIGKNLNVLTSYSFNWEAVGIKMKITKSNKNRVYELNNKKAVDIYREYLGNKTANNLPAIGIEFPLIIEDKNMNIGRAVLKKFEDGSLLFAGNFNKGDYVRFGVGNASLISAESKKNISYLKSKQPESIFVYSCMARRRFIPKLVSEEASFLNNITTTVGFFTYGEFFHKNNKNYLLNETMTTLALSENKFSSVETILELDTKKQPTNLETISNLANRISRDFEYINKNLGHLIDEKIKHIESIYHKDHLTKVNNRFQLIKDFKKTENLSLILINIDGFRSLNGFYGNSVGDFVLIELSKKFKKIIKNKPYKLYRLNADEFALLKFSKTTKKDFENFIQFINHELQDTVLNYKEVEIHIDFTIGAISQKTERPLALVDFALKQARINKKPYYIYDKSINLNEKYSENIKMANKIKKALKEDRIIPYYQAIIDNKTKKVVKYEALVRLIDGDKVISPFFFLDISKKIRLYNQITKAVVRHSFKKFSHNEFDFSINLTIDDIANKDTIDYIFEQLEVYDVKDRLIFEITETEEIKNYDILIDFIKKAQAMGIKIAIDDFGTGYSNFNYMIKLTPDIIKIDGSMIKNIEHNKDSQILTKLIVNSVKEMKMKMVAEFVENKEIFEIIKEMGIDYSQGYYFSQPKEDL